MKTRKNKHLSKKTQKTAEHRNAVCVLHPNKHNVSGTIHFTETKTGVSVKYDIKGLKDGDHGFHIHEYGDLTDGCTSSCAHFNPYGLTHGGPKDIIRHAGDLGNIHSMDGISKGSMKDKIISLDPSHICNIIGRAVVVHEDPDDLGKGGNEESLITGNAGKRLACGIIGFSKNC